MRYAAILVEVGEYLDSNQIQELSNLYFYPKIPAPDDSSSAKHQILPIADDGDLNIVASFDRTGDYIYTGNAKGKVLVLNSQTLKIEASFKITVGTSSATSVKSIEFARRGK